MLTRMVYLPKCHTPRTVFDSRCWPGHKEGTEGEDTAGKQFLDGDVNHHFLFDILIDIGTTSPVKKKGNRCRQNSSLYSFAISKRKILGLRRSSIDSYFI